MCAFLGLESHHALHCNKHIKWHYKKENSCSYLDGAVERSGAEKQGLVGILGTRTCGGPSKAQCNEMTKTI